MRAYDMQNVNMKRRGGFLSLQVPGLAERRPSLVHGDYIFAKLASAGTDVDSAFQVPMQYSRFFIQTISYEEKIRNYHFESCSEYLSVSS